MEGHMSKTYFQTKDLGEAAALLCSDLPIAAVSLIHSKCWFLFSPESKAKELVSMFWNHELSVDAQDYFHAINRLKSIVYERKS